MLDRLSTTSSCVIPPASNAGHTRCCITFESNRYQKAAHWSSSFPAAADADADAGADASHCVDARASSLEELGSLLVGGIALTVAGDKYGNLRYTNSPMMDGGHLPMAATHIVT